MLIYTRLNSFTTHHPIASPGYQIIISDLFYTIIAKRAETIIHRFQPFL